MMRSAAQFMCFLSTIDAFLAADNQLEPKKACTYIQISRAREKFDSLRQEPEEAQQNYREDGGALGLAHYVSSDDLHDFLQAGLLTAGAFIVALADKIIGKNNPCMGTELRKGTNCLKAVGDGTCTQEELDELKGNMNTEEWEKCLPDCLRKIDPSACSCANLGKCPKGWTCMYNMGCAIDCAGSSIGQECVGDALCKRGATCLGGVPCYPGETGCRIFNAGVCNSSNECILWENYQETQEEKNQREMLFYR